MLRTCSIQFLQKDFATLPICWRCARAHSQLTNSPGGGWIQPLPRHLQPTSHELTLTFLLNAFTWRSPEARTTQRTKWLTLVYYPTYPVATTRSIGLPPSKVTVGPSGSQLHRLQVFLISTTTSWWNIFAPPPLRLLRMFPLLGALGVSA